MAKRYKVLQLFEKLEFIPELKQGKMHSSIDIKSHAYGLIRFAPCFPNRFQTISDG